MAVKESFRGNGYGNLLMDAVFIQLSKVKASRTYFFWTLIETFENEDEAITNGFITAFLVCVIRILCWAHVVRDVDKRLNVTGIKEF